ncbi:MAG: hypothetical protein VXX28_01980 [Verrucomicrobiota bacterium]|nr:hypothetical protein [Verrucomicrobiota bacterium]
MELDKRRLKIQQKSILGGSWGQVGSFFHNFGAFFGRLGSSWFFHRIFSDFGSIFQGLGRVLGGFGLDFLIIF